MYLRQGGGKASSKRTSMYIHVPPQGVDFGLQTLSRCTMISTLVSLLHHEKLGVWELAPRTIFLNQTVCNAEKCPFTRWRDGKGSA